MNLAARRIASYHHLLKRYLSADSKDIGVLMERFKPLITDRMVHETGVSANLTLTKSTWTLDLRDDGTIKCGVDDTADISLEMADETFLKLVDGSTSTAAAYMAGELKLDGSIMTAMKLSGLFKSMQGAIKETIE